MSNQLNKRDIKSSLGENNERFNIIFKEETGSTNTDLKKLALENNADNAVVIALSQTAGRGRLGRSFYSPDNSGIYLSYFIKPTLNEADIVALTSAVAVSVCKALEKNADINPQIKWVNDIYYNNKKLCGILLEAVRDTSNKLLGIVVGIGINCVRSTLPVELEDIVGYISDFCEDFDINRLTADLLIELSHTEELIKDKSLVIEYKKRSLVIGKKIKVMDEPMYNAYALNVDEKCSLIIKTEDGDIKTLSTGEISIRIDK